MMVLLIALVPLMGLAQTDLKKISKEEVGIGLIEKGEKFLDDYFAQMRSGNTFDFTEIGTKKIISAITPSVQKKVYEQVQEMAGEYKSESFKED